MRTAVVLLLIMPMAASSAIMAEMVSAGVSPGIAIMSSPTEHTQVMASSFSIVRAPERAAASMALSSLTGMKAPDKPPTWLDANTPPFFTASLSMARMAVDPGAPIEDSPSVWKISPTLSPTAGVGANERSATPKGMFMALATPRPISSPTRVTL